MSSILQSSIMMIFGLGDDAQELTCWAKSGSVFDSKGKKALIFMTLYAFN
jgi:hypothetical protein